MLLRSLRAPAQFEVIVPGLECDEGRADRENNAAERIFTDLERGTARIALSARMATAVPCLEPVLAAAREMPAFEASELPGELQVIAAALGEKSGRRGVDEVDLHRPVHAAKPEDQGQRAGAVAHAGGAEVGPGRVFAVDGVVARGWTRRRRPKGGALVRRWRGGERRGRCRVAAEVERAVAASRGTASAAGGAPAVEAETAARGGRERHRGSGAKVGGASRRIAVQPPGRGGTPALSLDDDGEAVLGRWRRGGDERGADFEVRVDRDIDTGAG